MKTKITIAALAALLILGACKKEEPYDFGSSDNQSSGGQKHPQQPSTK